MSKPLHRCITKATTAEEDGVRRSLSWAVSRRGILEVRPDALACGDWFIPYSEIDEAVLYGIRQMLIPGYVLLVKSRGVTSQHPLIVESGLDPLIDVPLLDPLPEFPRRLSLVLAESPEQTDIDLVLLDEPEVVGTEG